MIIAIDGPAASGKGWVAQRLCSIRGYSNFATGEIFRAFAYCMTQVKPHMSSEEVLQRVIHGDICYEWDNATFKSTVYLNDIPISPFLYTSYVSHASSEIAAVYTDTVIDAIRHIGNVMLRNGESLVVEGRNVASVLFPQAEYKFYLDAPVEVRAFRRVEDYKKRGEYKTLDEMILDLKERDLRDSTRAIAPLKRVPDAIYVDSGNLTGEETVDIFLSHIPEA